MRLAASLLLVAAMLCACEGAEKATADAPSNPCAGAPDDAVSVADAWIRPAGAGGTTALYAVICNRAAADDSVVRVATAAASAVEIHETTTGADGTLAMRMLGRLPLPAGGAAIFAPGGLHVMLIGLAGPLENGGHTEVVFEFEHAPAIEMTVRVRTEGEAHEH